jgi:hypothetical protein
MKKILFPSLLAGLVAFGFVWTVDHAHAQREVEPPRLPPALPPSLPPQLPQQPPLGPGTVPSAPSFSPPSVIVTPTPPEHEPTEGGHHGDDDSTPTPTPFPTP